MPIRIKICGLNDEASVIAAVVGGVDFIGFSFVDGSPSAVTPLRAAELVRAIPPDVKKVGLFVNPTNEELHETLNKVSLDIIQCHGTETAARLYQIRHLTRKLIIKSIRNKVMLAEADSFTDTADWLLFDPSSWSGQDHPHGNRHRFYDPLLKGRHWPLPWFLGGDLNESCLKEALQATQADLIDVSSGIEERLGYKSPERIRRFLKLAKRLKRKALPYPSSIISVS